MTKRNRIYPADPSQLSLELMNRYESAFAELSFSPTKKPKLTRHKNFLEITQGRHHQFLGYETPSRRKGARLDFLAFFVGVSDIDEASRILLPPIDSKFMSEIKSDKGARYVFGDFEPILEIKDYVFTDNRYSGLSVRHPIMHIPTGSSGGLSNKFFALQKKYIVGPLSKLQETT